MFELLEQVHKFEKIEVKIVRHNTPISIMEECSNIPNLFNYITFTNRVSGPELTILTSTVDKLPDREDDDTPDTPALIRQVKPQGVAKPQGVWITSRTEQHPRVDLLTHSLVPPESTNVGTPPIPDPNIK